MSSTCSGAKTGYELRNTIGRGGSVAASPGLIKSCRQVIGMPIAGAWTAMSFLTQICKPFTFSIPKPLNYQSLLFSFLLKHAMAEHLFVIDYVCTIM